MLNDNSTRSCTYTLGPRPIGPYTNTHTIHTALFLQHSVNSSPLSTTHPRWKDVHRFCPGQYKTIKIDGKGLVSGRVFCCVNSECPAMVFAYMNKLGGNTIGWVHLERRHACIYSFKEQSLYDSGRCVAVRAESTGSEELNIRRILVQCMTDECVLPTRRIIHRYVRIPTPPANIIDGNKKAQNIVWECGGKYCRAKVLCKIFKFRGKPTRKYVWPAESSHLCQDDTHRI